MRIEHVVYGWIGYRDPSRIISNEGMYFLRHARCARHRKSFVLGISRIDTGKTPSLCGMSLYKLNMTKTTQGDSRPSSPINHPTLTYSSIHSAPQRYYTAKEVSTASKNTLRFDSLRKHLNRAVAKALITDPAHSIFTNHHPSIAPSIAPR